MNPTEPKISVVIATHNRVDLLRRAVSSVNSQTSPPVELIVVDDHSTDGTSEYLETLQPIGVKVALNNGSGACSARNQGLSLATTDWVAFLDDDDFLLDGWSTNLFSKATDDTLVISCGANDVDADGAFVRERLPVPMGPSFGGHSGLFLGGSMLARRTALLQIGGFDEDLACSHQTDLILRLLESVDENTHRVESVAVPLVAIERRPPSQHWRSDPRVLFEGTTQILDRHADALRRDPTLLSSYELVAAVASAKAGDMKRARQYIRRPIRRDPSNWSNYLRFVSFSMGILSVWFWRRRRHSTG